MRDSLGTRVANICNLASVTVLDRKSATLGVFLLVVYKIRCAYSYYNTEAGPVRYTLPHACMAMKGACMD